VWEWLEECKAKKRAADEEYEKAKEAVKKVLMEF
jgi:hypothetical protein